MVPVTEKGVGGATLKLWVGTQTSTVKLLLSLDHRNGTVSRLEAEPVSCVSSVAAPRGAPSKPESS